MLLSLEVPVRYLNVFDRYQDYHFVLADWALQDKTYKNFMKDSPKVIYLDNGYNETKECVDPDTLVGLAEDLGANYVVAPDPEDDPQTHLDILKEWRNMHFQTIGVLHDSYKPYYDQIQQLAHVLAIPYRAKRARKPIGERTMHYFGFRSLKETYELARGTHFHSMDTSVPIKLALQGRCLDSFDYTNHRPDEVLKTKPEYLDLVLDPKTLALALYNSRVLFYVTCGQTPKEAIKSAY